MYFIDVFSCRQRCCGSQKFFINLLKESEFGEWPEKDISILIDTVIELRYSAYLECPDAE